MERRGSCFAAGIAALILSLAACAGDPPGATAPPATTPEADRQAFVEAVRPTRHTVPVVAVLALNEGTETTDFLVPHAVFQRSGAASVEAVAPRKGRVTLMPALAVGVDDDLTGFDRRHPAGADIVVVPAMHTDDDPAVLSWLRAQAAKGAVIVGVCSGALVVGQAGLLDGRRFTGHWHDRGRLLQRHPTATYVPDRRYLADRRVVTTTGVSASLPVSLALVEAIGGRARVAALARELGVASWAPDHVSAPFRIDAGRAWTYLANSAAFWRHEEVVLRVQDGVDDVQLALAADAWSRTHRSSVVAVADGAGPLRMHSGLTLLPAAASTTTANRLDLTLPASLAPALQLERSLCEIGRRHGAATRDWVALEMEHRLGDAETRGCRDHDQDLQDGR